MRCIKINRRQLKDGTRPRRVFAQANTLTPTPHLNLNPQWWVRPAGIGVTPGGDAGRVGTALEGEDAEHHGHSLSPHLTLPPHGVLIASLIQQL